MARQVCGFARVDSWWPTLNPAEGERDAHAWSDEPWVLDGAAVHVSFLGYDNGTEETRTLDGTPVNAINPNLTAGLDLTRARRLEENLGIAFMGDTKGGPFDIPTDLALDMLGRPNRTDAATVRCSRRG